MRWDQIEERWTTMTLRIRSDTTLRIPSERHDGPGSGVAPRGVGERGQPLEAQAGYGRLPTQP